MPAGNISIANSFKHFLLLRLLQTPSDLIQVFLSDIVHLSPVGLPQLLQLPVVIMLHFLPHLLENVSQLGSESGGQFTAQMHIMQNVTILWKVTEKSKLILRQK